MEEGGGEGPLKLKTLNKTLNAWFLLVKEYLDIVVLNKEVSTSSIALSDTGQMTYSMSQQKPKT